MAFSRFTLNTSQLDDATVGLDGSPFPMQGTGASSLGGTSATASATVKRSATGTSSLGGTSSTASVTVKHSATGASSLNGISASASAIVRVPVTATSSLGGGTNAVVATVVVPAVGFIGLGGLEADAKGKSKKGVFANADLGGLDASATSRDVKSARFDADLGNVVGSATADINPPEPPVIPPSGSRWWKQPAAPVTKHEPPEQIVVQIPKPRRPLLVSVVAVARLGGADVGALGSITFSTLDDDAEVLLLV